MKLNLKEVESLISCSADKRYTYFIKQICDREEVWGLYRNGWALASTNDETIVFPFWSAEDYAVLCAEGNWKNFEPKLIHLEDFLQEWLPQLEKDKILIGVFYIPNDSGVISSIDRLYYDINAELSKYG